MNRNGGDSKAVFLGAENGDFREGYIKRWNEIQKGVPNSMSEEMKPKAPNITQLQERKISHEWFG